MKIEESRKYITQVMTNVSSFMFGMEEIIKLSLASLYTGGHILLEGNPGLGKTMLVRTLANCLGFGNVQNSPVERWGRIQFTPDLMPADITGTKMPNAAGEFVFQEGPIFKWLLLADEINRATPKTQSAMLEAMGEKQVTVLGKTYELTPETKAFFFNDAITAKPPFIVFATQNPIDQEGTYDLPEAQADRFMFKVRMSSPGADTLEKIMQKDAGALVQKIETGADVKVEDLPSEATALKQFMKITQYISSVKPMALVQNHIVNMLLASNGQFKELRDLRSTKTIGKYFNDYVAIGLGPRAATAMMLGAKGSSVIDMLCDTKNSGRDEHFSTQVGLFKTVLPVLRHRLKFKFDWESRYRQTVRADGLSVAALHDKLLKEFVLHTAPSDSAYGSLLKKVLLTTDAKS